MHVCVCGSQAPAPPPPSAAESETEKNLRETFKKISGADLEVDAYELQDILSTAFKGMRSPSTSFLSIL